MCAAAASGIYKTIEEAQQHMNGGYSNEYIPDSENSKKYAVRYRKYRELGSFIEQTINY
jgi:L-ribulokinase